MKNLFSSCSSYPASHAKFISCIFSNFAFECYCKVMFIQGFPIFKNVYMANSLPSAELVDCPTNTHCFPPLPPNINEYQTKCLYSTYVSCNIKKIIKR